MNNARIRFYSKHRGLLWNLAHHLLGPENASIVSTRKGSILLDVANTERAAELVFEASQDCTGNPAKTLLAWSIRLQKHRAQTQTTNQANHQRN